MKPDRSACCILAVILSLPTLHAEDVRITGLTTESVANPMGVESLHPGFSWNYAGDARGFRQASWRITVASSATGLASDKPDLWDSGWNNGAETLNIHYAGAPLQSGKSAVWQVETRAVDGGSFRSEPASFEMGLLDETEWRDARWITRNTEPPASIAALAEKWTDYQIETRFRILETCANLHFRARYIGGNGYSVQIEPGAKDNVKLLRHDGPKHVVLAKFPSPVPLGAGEWHTIRVDARGDTFDLRIDGTPTGSFHDKTHAAGVPGVGALREDGTWGRAEFDDFKVSRDDTVLFSEDFNHPSLNNFQDLLFCGGGFSQPREGVLSVRATRSLIEDKRGLEAPLLRKEFMIEKPVLSARAYVCGIGYHEMSLNGNKVGDRMLEPGYSRYDKRSYYTIDDIKDALKPGRNAVGFELGRGWFGIRTPMLWGEYTDGSWISEPKLMALLRIDFTDGTTVWVRTDESFRTAPGPVLFDSLKAGETHDHRNLIPGWNQPGFDDSKWTPARIAASAAKPEAQLFPPIRVIERVPAVSVKPLGEGAWAVDFGKHMAGNAVMKTNGRAGERVIVQYAEKWKDQGVPLMHPFDPAATGCYQQDTFVLSGSKDELCRPRFSYKGFRFLIVWGFPGTPEPGDFTAEVIHSDMRPTGTFDSSSKLLNSISDASLASIRSNMHSIPTDCPTFEKLGWTCDDAAPLEAMMYGYDVEALYRKRLRDYADDIRPDGLVSDVVPGTWNRAGNDPAWNGSLIAIASKLHSFYGADHELAEHYDTLKRYHTWLTRAANQPGKPPHIVNPDQRKGYGDWVPPDHKGGHGPEGHSIYQTCYYFWYTTLMRDIAASLGNTADRDAFDRQAGEIKRAFNERFFDAAAGAYFSVGKQGGFREASQVLPLYFGLVPDDSVEKVFGNLCADIRKRDGHFWVGILGFEFIADVLMKHGRSDLAYEGHLKTDFPSLGNMIREGATTLWESYSLETTRSLNHKMFSTITEWMFREVAGLGDDPSAPGFRRALIAPKPCLRFLTHARATYDSKSGRYESGWKIDGDAWILETSVPPNAESTVVLPVRQDAALEVREGDRLLWKDGKATADTPGITQVEATPQGLRVSTGSGRFRFSCEKRFLIDPSAN